MLAKIKSEVKVVTPELAGKWMKKNQRNRTVKQAKVDQYARAMKSGRWELNGESIKFDTDGNLIDGQNRLLACIQSGSNFQAVITHGLNGASKLTIDTGTSRTSADILKINEIVDAYHKAVGAAATYYFKYKQGRLFHHGISVSPAEVAEIVRSCSGFSDALKASAMAYPLIPRGLGTFLHRAFSELSREEADLFFEKLGTGDELPRNSPILVLRDRLQSFRASKTKPHRNEVLALIIKGWNAFRAKKRLSVLRFDKRESWPTIS